MEFVIVEQATVMIKGRHAAQSDIYRVTRWIFVQEDDGSVSVKGRETHASQNGIHKIFTDGKLENVDTGLEFLFHRGVFKTNSQLELYAEIPGSSDERRRQV